MIGLFKAIRDFKISERGNSFYNFANMCIKRQILSGVSNANRLKHSPLNNAIFIEKEEFLENLETPEKIQLNKEKLLDFNDSKNKLLTKYEKKVLELFIDGKKYKEIAEVVRRDEKSVNNAMQRIRKKFKENN
jgi:RNA polymerase sporulation-specific sigma factor